MSKALSPSDWTGMMKSTPLITLSRQERRKAERSRKKAKKKKIPKINLGIILP